MKGKKAFFLIIVAVVAIVAVLVGLAVGSYNGTVKMREDVDAAEAQIKNRLKQRHDKMLQLIDAVEGLQEHAETIYNMITAAREAYNSATTPEEFMAADGLQTQALTDLRALVEDNPEGITANEAYYGYMSEVSATENALATARRDYNEAVRKYNTSVNKFPKTMYIGMFGFEKQLDYWDIDEGDEELPLGNFSDNK